MPVDPSLQHARSLDAEDPLTSFRERFSIPQVNGKPQVYLVGNSLGLQPKSVYEIVNQELEKWKRLGVRGHFESQRPWLHWHELLTPGMARLVGAEYDEVVVMNTLTVNLHLMMATFYRPTAKRNKVLIESHAFPSDWQAVQSQIRLHGFDPAESMVTVPHGAESELLCEDLICNMIEQHRSSLALVLLPGVQYYTGQFLDIKRITETAHRYNISVGFDLAHAVGNVPLELHGWNVDFAVWCNYKYMNSGPGAIGGCFVHQRHARDKSMLRMAGWWGHDKATRFAMQNQFDPIPTAEGWQLSNPPIFSLAPILASLEIFEAAGGIAPLREKSLKLTGYLESLLLQELGSHVNIITPQTSAQRGCQLSLDVATNERGNNKLPILAERREPSGGKPESLRSTAKIKHRSCFSRVPKVQSGKHIHQKLESAGVNVDWREPAVIRVAPVPLYNSFEDVHRFVSILKEILGQN